MRSNQANQSRVQSTAKIFASVTSSILAVGMIFLVGCTGQDKVDKGDQATTANGIALINNEGSIPFDEVPASFEKVSDSLFRKALAKPESAGGTTKFTRLSGTGINYKNEFDRQYSLLYVETGSGVAIADYDNDGLKDVYLTGTDIDNRLYKNMGNFKFKDVTFEANVDGRIRDENLWASGASFADIDNDGDLDLYVCNLAAPNILYINQHDGTFKEQTIPRGANYTGASKQAGFCDYDRDGDLDFYLATYQDMMPEEEAVEEVDGELRVKKGFEEYAVVFNGFDSKAGEKDILFENLGDGTFKKHGKDVGIDGWDANLASHWFDYDNDGWQDIYVTSDFKQPDHLYRNNRDGTFTDVLKDTVRRTPWFSMGLDSGDLNNDGHLDLMVGDMADPDHYGQKVNMGDMGSSGWFLVWGAPRQFMQNCLFIATGTGRFMDHASITGLAKTDWTWAVRMVDLDNDGKQDVYVTNGHSRDNMNGDLVARYQQAMDGGMSYEEFEEFFSKVPWRKDTNMVFQNKGDLKFEAKGPEWGLDHLGISHGASFADLDGDGDLDAIVNNYYENASIYRNDSDQGSRLLIQLRSKDSNHFAIGSKVELWQNGNYQQRNLMPNRGYLGADPMELHFGLADDSKIEKLKVTWPDGTSQSFTDLDVNHVYRIIEAKERTPEQAKEAVKPMFAKATKEMGVEFRHTENDFDDFVREPLLPFQLSRLGGSVALSDVNGDGFVDAYCGGAAGQAGQLLINEGGKSFKSVSGPWMGMHAASEDMGALFFDADGDGDDDLYVASGGNDFHAGEVEYRDRLYLNDGSGKFTTAEDALPEFKDSSGAVAAADFDRDGDLDLFVGSRSIPGSYPLTPESRLLINEGGTFVEAEAEVSGGVQTKGLVSSALWSDYDNDGWVDLILALEWGPVAFFKNEDGKLVDATVDSGIHENTGWWHGIAAGDLDADGDMDYVVTNHGKNTKYHTSPAHPHRLYYDDFDNSGTLDLVEAEYEGETEYPVRGRSCSSRCMPFIADKFESFETFSKASLADIYETDKRQRPFHEITMLETTVLWNDGEGFFEAKPLGYLAQSSPAFGVEIADFDGDANLDIMLANNFFGSQPETNLMDGGLSLLIRGNGDQSFTEVWPAQSGIVLDGDSNGLAVADVDGDGDFDAMVAVNDEPLEVLRNDSAAQKPVPVKLIGPQGNRNGIGASVTIEGKFGKQRFEAHAGGSYLSQSPVRISIPASFVKGLEKVTVHWPDGTKTEQPVNVPPADELLIEHQNAL